MVCKTKEMQKYWRIEKDWDNYIIIMDGRVGWILYYIINYFIIKMEIYLNKEKGYIYWNKKKDIFIGIIF